VPFSIRWHDAARPFSVDFHFRTIRRLEDLAGNTAGHGMGVLLGSGSGTPVQEVSVTDVCLIATNDAAPVPLSDGIARQISAYTSGAERRMYPVGLFFVSNESVHLPAVAHLLCLAHLFDPPVPLFAITKQKTGPALVRLNLWSPAAGGIEQLALEFPLDWRLLAQRAFHPFVPNFKSAPATVRPLSAVTPPPQAAALPPPPPPSPSGPVYTPNEDLLTTQSVASNDSSVLRVPKWIAASLGVGIISAISVWVIMRPERSNGKAAQTAIASGMQTAPAGLALEVSRLGADLQVKWNRTSPEVVSAQSGLLRVNENGTLTVIPLDAEQLQTGRILYTPRSATLDLRLEVTTRHGRAQESVRIIQSFGSGPGLSNKSTQTWFAPKRNTGNASVEVESTTRTIGDDASGPTTTSARVAKTDPPGRTFTLPPVADTKRPAPSIDVPEPLLQQVVIPPVIPLPANPMGDTPLEIAQQQPMRTAGPKARAITHPVLKSRVNIELPAQTRMLLHGGTVVVELKVLVDERGGVARVEPVPGSGLNTHVAHIAAQRARHWRFDPALLDGKPVPAEYVLRLNLKH
jgi:hypothetical protein